jgi:hypothetical protein
VSLKPRTRTALWSAALVAVYLVGAVFGPALRERRVTEGLRMPGMHDLGPLQFLGTVVLGGFRGVLVDVLWIKAMEYQQEERFFDLYYMTTLITKFQPYVPQIWTFNGWNLSYNISVKFLDPPDKWLWVKRGVNLLEDGLEQNPNDKGITHAMGWTFSHKIAGDPYYTERTLKDETLWRKWEDLGEDAPPEIMTIDPEARHPYDIAAFWYLRSRQCPYRRSLTFTRWAMEGSIRWAFRNRAEQLIQEGKYVKAKAYTDAFWRESLILEKRFPKEAASARKNSWDDYRDLRRSITDALGPGAFDTPMPPPPGQSGPKDNEKSG